MRKLFTLALCFMACLAVNARVIYGSETETVAITSSMHGSSVTDVDGVLTFPNAWWNGLTISSTTGVDLKGYGKFSYTYDSYAVGDTEKTDGVPFRIELYDADGNSISTNYGVTSILLPPNCTKVVLNSCNANETVKNLKLVMGDKATSVTEDDMASLRELTTNSDYSGWVNNIPSFPKTLPKATVLFGNGDGSNESVWADVSDYEKMTFVVSDVTTAGSQLRVWMWNGTGVTTLYPHLESEYESVTDWTAVNKVTIAGTYVVNLSGLTGLKGVKTNWDGANCTVSDVYLTKYKEYPSINLYSTATTPISSLTGTDAGWAGRIVYPIELQSQGTCIGDGDGSKESTHVDISGYSKLSFNVTEGSDQGLALRVWIWDEANSQVVTLYPHPEADYATADFTKAYEITEPGVYSVNISAYNNLKGIKAANKYQGQTPVTIDYAWVSNGESYLAVDEARTFSYSKPLDFTENTDVEAYIATACSDDKVTMEKVTGTVPANTGLVLKPLNENVVVSIKTCGKGTEDVSGNLLVATTAETTVAKAETGTNYVLGGTGSTLGWYSIGGTSATLAANKCYLHAPVSGAKSLTMSFEENETTGISSVRSEELGVSSSIYNLAGQRVNANAKGIVIINGKKYLNK